MLRDVDLEALVGKKMHKDNYKRIIDQFVVNYWKWRMIVKRKACYWAFTIADSL